MNDREIIKSVVENCLPGSKVILFGSRSREDFQKDSDYDLLIISKDEIDKKEKLRLSGIIGKNLVEEGFSTDILIQTPSTFEINKSLIGHIVRIAVREGISL